MWLLEVILLEVVVCLYALPLLEEWMYMCMYSTYIYKSKMVLTCLCILCWKATVLEGLLGEYHFSSAALATQHPEVTKQPLIRDRSTTPNSLWC